MLQETNDSGTVQARYTTETSTYYGVLLHMWRSSNVSRFPLYDAIGTARMLVDGSGTVTDSYHLDAWGHQFSSSGSTVNPYKYGGAWGYITDPSGMLQLGARFYWPEVGRFVSQDPIGDGMNWYAYASDNPATWTDPQGLKRVCRQQWSIASGVTDHPGEWTYAFTCKAGLFLYAIYDVYYRWVNREIWTRFQSRQCCKDDECPGAEWECGDWSKPYYQTVWKTGMEVKKVLLDAGGGITKVMLSCGRQFNKK